MEKVSHIWRRSIANCRVLFVSSSNTHIDAATYRSFEHYNEYQYSLYLFSCIWRAAITLFRISEDGSLELAEDNWLYFRAETSTWMSMAYKMVAICLSSIFDCIDSICSQFKSPLTIISITAALFFVPLRALSFITPIMSILVFF